MKILASAAVTLAALGFSSTAFAETLNYDFAMKITSIADGYGVFDEFSEGGMLNVSVAFDTLGDSDGTVGTSVAGLGVVSTGGWGGSWDDVQYNGSTWDAYRGVNADLLVVNGVGIHSGSVHQEVYLTFGKTASGQFELITGSMNIGVYNGSSAYLTAEFVPGAPTSVPELDPNSGMAAFALVGGGVTIAWSRRRRELSVASS